MAAPRAARRPPAGPHPPAAAPAPPAWPSLALAALAFAVYAAGTAGVSADKDSSEFTLVLATAGVAHPTGYPLYTALGHVFGLLVHALGAGWPRAAALWSALAAAVAVGALHAFTARGLAARGTPSPRAWLVALLPAALLGALPVWTLEATVAEVNAFHVAWLSLAVLVVARETRKSTRPGPARALVTGLVLGAGLAHHLSSVLWIVPLVAVVLPRVAAAGGPARAAFGAGLIAAPVAGLAFVAWRASAPGAVHWPLLEPGTGALLDHVSGAQYRHYLGRFAPSPGQMSLLARFVFPLLPLALAGLVLGTRRGGRPTRSPLGVALLVGGLAQTAFAFTYGVPDPVPYFLPVLAVGFASAPAGVLAWPRAARLAGPLKAIAAVAILVALPFWVAIAGGRRVTFERFDTRVRSMWTSLPDSPGWVLWPDDMSHKLLEYQRLDGLGRALTVVDPVLLAHPAARARFRADHGFDPFEGVPEAVPGAGEASVLTDSLAHRLGARTAWPVFVFDPATPSILRLRPPEGAGAR